MVAPRLTATPRDRSILFLVATTTAVMCSQAFPAIGSTIIPRNAWLTPVTSVRASMDPHKNLRGGPAASHTQARRADMRGTNVNSAGCWHVASFQCQQPVETQLGHCEGTSQARTRPSHVQVASAD
jgi:hypothetical protein